MRNAVIKRKFEHLRVDQDEAELRGVVPEEHRENHRVDADRLARTRRAGHEEMRRLCEIHDEGLPGDVLADCEGER